MIILYLYFIIAIIGTLITVTYLCTGFVEFDRSHEFDAFDYFLRESIIQFYNILTYLENCA